MRNPIDADLYERRVLDQDGQLLGFIRIDVENVRYRVRDRYENFIVEVGNLQVAEAILHGWKFTL